VPSVLTCKTNNEQHTFCHAGTDKIASVLVDASGCLQGGVELRLPDEKFASQYELRPAAFNQAANEPAAAKHLEECLGDWCNQVRTCRQIGAALCCCCCCPAAMSRNGLLSADAALLHSRFTLLKELATAAIAFPAISYAKALLAYTEQ
jgi:hypothetical protein